MKINTEKTDRTHSISLVECVCDVFIYKIPSMSSSSSLSSCYMMMMMMEKMYRSNPEKTEIISFIHDHDIIIIIITTSTRSVLYIDITIPIKLYIRQYVQPTKNKLFLPAVTLK